MLFSIISNKTTYFFFFFLIYLSWANSVLSRNVVLFSISCWTISCKKRRSKQISWGFTVLPRHLAKGLISSPSSTESRRLNCVSTLYLGLAINTLQLHLGLFFSGVGDGTQGLVHTTPLNQAKGREISKRGDVRWRSAKIKTNELFPSLPLTLYCCLSAIVPMHKKQNPCGFNCDIF